MMLFKSKEYPHGKYQILWLQGSFLKRIKLGQGFGFWKHPRIPFGSYADWSIRIMFIEIKKWLSEKQLKEI